MRFMVIVKADANSEAGVLPTEQQLADMAKYNEELVKAGVMLAGEGQVRRLCGKTRRAAEVAALSDLEAQRAAVVERHLPQRSAGPAFQYSRSSLARTASSSPSATHLF